HYVCRSATRRVCLLGRAFLEDDDPRPAVARIRQSLKLYPYAPGGTGTSIGAFLGGAAPLEPPAAPPAMRFVEGTGQVINTIPPNDASYFELLDAAVQAEPV